MDVTEENVASAPMPTGDSESLGFGAKLWNLFVDPRRTFSATRANHEWVIVWLLVSVLSIVAYLPMKDIVKQSQMSSVEERLDQNPSMTDEQKAEILSGMEENFENPIYLLFVPISQILLILIVSGILLFIGNILLGGSAGYLRMMNAYAWTMMIVIPGSIVLTPLILAKGSMDVSIGLGVLTTPETAPFLKKFLSSIEVFALWQVWLSSVAVSVVAGVDGKKALWSVGAVWLTWVIIQSGLATLGIQFGA